MIGAKRERVAIQRSSGASPDPYGDVANQDWSTIGTYWAQVEPISGKEYFAQDRTKEDVTHRFRFRYSATVDGVTGADRLSWNSETFDIVSKINTGARDREVQIMARRTF